MGFFSTTSLSFTGLSSDKSSSGPATDPNAFSPSEGLPTSTPGRDKSTFNFEHTLGFSLATEGFTSCLSFWLFFLSLTILTFGLCVFCGLELLRETASAICLSHTTDCRAVSVSLTPQFCRESQFVSAFTATIDPCDE